MGLFSEMMEEASEQSSRIAELEDRVRKLETDLAWERNENARLRANTPEARARRALGDPRVSVSFPCSNGIG